MTMYTAPLPRLEPDLLAARLTAHAELIAAVPDEIAALIEVIFEHLEGGPAVDDQEPWAHLVGHAQHLLPAVMADPRTQPVLAALDEEYRRVLESSPTDFSPAKIGITGGIVAVVILAEIIHSCVEGPHPAPGTSAAVSC